MDKDGWAFGAWMGLMITNWKVKKVVYLDITFLFESVWRLSLLCHPGICVRHLHACELCEDVALVNCVGGIVCDEHLDHQCVE